jgi:hypothetical protein
MINVIDNFYPENVLGILTLKFLNLPFQATWQSNQQYYSDRMQGYPCHETFHLKDNDYGQLIFKEQFKLKTNINILHMQTFLRKTKLKELQKSPSWGQYKPHVDGDIWDYAGVVYFNGASLKDGTRMYSYEHDYEPTLMVAAKLNRCIFYNSLDWHSQSMEQTVEERWVQPFSLITKETTLEKYNKNKFNN